MHFFQFLRRIKFCSGYFRQFFLIWGKKKQSLSALDKWSSYTVTNIRNLTWEDSALAVLDKWPSYRGGRLNMLDCNQVFKQTRDYNGKVKALDLRRWIFNPGVLCLKPLSDSKVDSAFHQEIHQMSTRHFWVLSGKKETAPTQ